MARMGFNAADVAPAQAFEPIPLNWYNARITESKNKPIAKGERLELEFTVEPGTRYAKRKIFEGINWKHESSEAQRIGQEQLSAVCHGVGILNLEDDQQLVNKVICIKVGIEPARTENGKTYEARNIIKGYRAYDPQYVVQDAPAAGQTPMGSAAPADAPAWMQEPNPSAPAQPDWANEPAPAGAAPTAATAAPAPAAPPAPGAAQAAPAAPAVKTDEERLAEGGWTIHPQNPAYWYKGEVVLAKADALAQVAPAAAPATPAAPPAAPAATTPAPAPAAAAAAPAAAPAAAAPAADGDTPPWLQS